MSVNYSELAAALLDRGDSRDVVVAFLCTEYGLDRDDANAIIKRRRRAIDDAALTALRELRARRRLNISV